MPRGLEVLAGMVQMGFTPDVSAGQTQRQILGPQPLGLALPATSHGGWLDVERCRGQICARCVVGAEDEWGVLDGLRPV